MLSEMYLSLTFSYMYTSRSLYSTNISINFHITMLMVAAVEVAYGIISVPWIVIYSWHKLVLCTCIPKCIILFHASRNNVIS